VVGAPRRRAGRERGRRDREEHAGCDEPSALQAGETATTRHDAANLGTRARDASVCAESWAALTCRRGARWPVLPRSSGSPKAHRCAVKRSAQCGAAAHETRAWARKPPSVCHGISG
jgi:hypothetical protein